MYERKVGPYICNHVGSFEQYRYVVMRSFCLGVSIIKSLNRNVFPTENFHDLRGRLQIP